VDILFTYHSNASEAQSLVREAEAIGRQAAAFQLDAGTNRWVNGQRTEVSGGMSREP